MQTKVAAGDAHAVVQLIDGDAYRKQQQRLPLKHREGAPQDQPHQHRNHQHLLKSQCRLKCMPPALLYTSLLLSEQAYAEGMRKCMQLNKALAMQRLKVAFNAMSDLNDSKRVCEYRNNRKHI